MRQYFEQSDDDAEYDAGSAEDGKGADGRIDVQQAIDVRFAGELRALRGAGDEDRFSDLGESALPAGFQRFVFEHGSRHKRAAAVGDDVPRLHFWGERG